MNEAREIRQELRSFFWRHLVKGRVAFHLRNKKRVPRDDRKGIEKCQGVISLEDLVGWYLSVKYFRENIVRVVRTYA